jgi:hypothetical protein
MKLSLTLCAVAFTAASVSLCVPAFAGNIYYVPLDVDVYDQPGGEGKPRPDFLPKCSKVELIDHRKDDWCHVKGDAVPGGNDGWIWCGKDDDGNYKLLNVKDSPGCPTADGTPSDDDTTPQQ